MKLKAILSHKIRTPLNGIIGMVQFGNRYIEQPECIKNCLSKISLSSHHLLILINDILDMSKIEGGKIEIHKENFDFGQILKALTTVFSDIYGSSVKVGKFYCRCYKYT